jgi:hypothetical protein
MSGSAELYHLAAVMRREGTNPRVAQDIGAGLRAGRSAIKANFRTHAMAVLPTRGGLDAWVVSSSFRSPVRVGARTARMSVVVSKPGHDLAGLDGGLVIHPFYGQRPWSHQGVPPNSISKPILEKGEDVLHDAVVDAADGVCRRIVSG